MPAASWLTEHADWLPSSGVALDLACGHGRHALWLAERGLTVHAVDRNRDALTQVAAEAAARSLTLLTELRDLEQGESPFAADTFDVIVVFNYLHRPLFPSLIRALRMHGLLVYETFTRAQARRGKPTNPDFLLEEGELLRLAQPLEILDSREGTFDERDVASVVARRR